MTPKERIEALRAALLHVVRHYRGGVGYYATEALRADDEAARQGEPSPPGPPTPPTRGMWGEGGAGPGRVYCDLPPDGWCCTREKGHEGPCAAVPSNDLALESIERLQAQVVHLASRLGEAHRDRDALAQRLESITGGVPTEPSPEAREAAREWLRAARTLAEEELGDAGVRLVNAVLSSLHDRYLGADVRAAIRDEWVPK